MIYADDLFAGAGGWSLAAHSLGVVDGGVETMPEARATREAAGFLNIHDDVWTFEPSGSARVLIASPPCQSFSAAGKGHGRKALDLVLRAIDNGVYEDIDILRAFGTQVGDERTALVLTPLHFATQYQSYEVLAWEQVPAVLPVWEACAEVLRGQGFSVWTGLLHAEQFGVAQTRKRAFLLASRVATLPESGPTPSHSRYYSRDPKRLDDGVLPWVSMAEALEYGLAGRPSPTITGGGTETGGAEPIAKLSRYTGRSDWVYVNGNREKAARRDVESPAPTVMFGERANDVRWTQERPSTTIVGSFRPDIVAAPGYRTSIPRQTQPDSVRVTVQEAGILQSFPAEFPWQGCKTKQYLQVGNAVPPLLARAALKFAMKEME